MKNFMLTSNDPLTKLTNEYGVKSWFELTEFVKKLPYGRNSNRSDFKLVLTEEKGTCSSKHALLKLLADLNNIPDIKLIIGIYKMNSINTPKIREVLNRTAIDYIPEAHCYLKIEERPTDYTSINSDFSKIKEYIIIEKEIQPWQVDSFKVNYHKKFIKKWLKSSNSLLGFNFVWKIREQCIESLTD